MHVDWLQSLELFKGGSGTSWPVDRADSSVRRNTSMSCIQTAAENCFERAPLLAKVQLPRTHIFFGVYTSYPYSKHFTFFKWLAFSDELVN
jgi:hypothetical protein